MKMTVHLEGSNRSELVAGLRAHLELLNGTNTETPTKTPAVETPPTPTKRATKKTAEPAEETFGETETTPEDFEEEETTTVTIEDLRKAFGAYTKKVGSKPGMTPEKARAKAMSVLTNFNVNRLADLDPKNYAAALAAVS